MHFPKLIFKLHAVSQISDLVPSDRARAALRQDGQAKWNERDKAKTWAQRECEWDYGSSDYLAH